MSRNLAHRPRHHLLRVQPQPPHLAHRAYLHPRWTYRQQRPLLPKHPLGYSLALVPYGWKRMQEARMQLRA